MFSRKLKITAFVVFVSAMETAAGVLNCAALADSKPATPKSDLSRLSAEAARLYSYVKKPLPGELKWQQIPWLIDLTKGIRLAREEKRPLLIWVSGDDPLERC